MSVTEATSNTTPRLSNSSTARNVRLFLGRGIIAIAWAAVFAAVSHSLTTAVTVGAGVLLVLYPLIDVAASLIDARSQHGSARQLLLGGAAVSAVAAVGLGVAATGASRTSSRSSAYGPPSAVRRNSFSRSDAVRSSAGSGRCGSPAASPS